MYISGPHREVYFGNEIHSDPDHIDNIEKVVLIHIITRLHPFTFENSPNGVGRCKAQISASTGHYPIDGKPGFLFGGNVYLLTWEFLPIMDIAFGTGLPLIPEIQIDATFLPLSYKISQLHNPGLIVLQQEFNFWTISYTSKSCTKADKKLQKVLLLALLPVAFCHLSIAFLRLYLSFSMAPLTASSSDESMIGLSPCPELFRRPANPFSRYRLTHRLTIGSETNKAQEISREESPSDFVNIIRLRFCTKALGSNSTVFSTSTFYFLVRVNSVMHLITLALKILNQKYMYNNFNNYLI